MKEVVLKNFFLGKATIDELREDLKAAVVSEGMIKKQRIMDMSGDYLVTCRDLVKLCDAILAEELAPNVLEAIGFCLIASDNFEWDHDDPDGNIVADIVNYWASPEINYPLNLKNVKMFREILKAGPSNSRITSDL